MTDVFNRTPDLARYCVRENGVNERRREPTARRAESA
jgi:hypothetical protein